MKTLISSMLIILAITVSSCEKDKSADLLASEVNLNKDNTGYMNAMSNRSAEISDPFELVDIVFGNGQIKITVLYSGGCKAHKFEIIWDEVLTNSNPPGINLVLIHDANGDNCEAYITETLIFDITDILDTLSFETISVSAHNGWNNDDSAEFEGTGYDFKFEEGDVCNVPVTARYVICGAGLYENLWFALDDSISAGIDDYYFYNYLQPVAIDSAIQGFVPVNGQKYLIGARIQDTHSYSNVPVCLAFSGPSVPVKIMCISEIK